jgi:predicted Mrr-cat superfamily restriction endonuclease
MFVIEIFVSTIKKFDTVLSILQTKKSETIGIITTFWPFRSLVFRYLDD